MRRSLLSLLLVLLAAARPAAAVCTAADVMACGSSCWTCSGSTCTGTFDGGARITLRGSQDFPLVDFDGPCEQRFVHTCTFVVNGPITVAATIHTPEGN